MANQISRILMKRSDIASKAPTAEELMPGELSLNTHDGKLYYKDSTGAVQYFTKDTLPVVDPVVQGDLTVQGNIIGTVDQAAKDGDGNVITTTYATKSELEGKLDVTGKAASATVADSATKATQDGAGNVIVNTYVTKTDAAATYATITALDGKADAEHSHEVDDVVGLQDALNAKAALASPTLTGTPKAPTATAGTNTTQIATTAFVTTAVANKKSVESATKATQDGSGNVITSTYATKGELSDLVDDVAAVEQGLEGKLSTDGKAASALVADTANAVAWGNITDKPSSYTPATHNQPSNTINAMTGYAKGTAATAIATTDTLNAAIGKLENKVDNANSSITTINSTLSAKANTADLADVATSGAYGDLTGTPSALKNPAALTVQNSAGTTIGSYDGSEAATIKLDASKVGLGNVTNESKATMFTSPALTGTPTAPTAAAGTNTTQIATTAFVNSALTGITTITGNAGTATKLASEVTIALSGDVTGSVTFDGSEDVTIEATIADDSHNHIIDNVDGLQTALNAKAALASPTFTGAPKAPTAAAGTNTTQIATTAFVTTAIANKTSVASATKATQDASGNVITTTYATKSENEATLAAATEYTDEAIASLVDSSPDTLNTLNELAAALGDDPNFATTIAGQIGEKANASDVVLLTSNQTIAGTKTFSAAIEGSITGNAATATKATQDGEGNVIVGTYLTINDASATYLGKTAKAASATVADSANAVAWSAVTGKPSSYTPSSHNQASSTINAMTGYAKATASAAIATTDTLNVAIGKVEYKVDTNTSSISTINTNLAKKAALASPTFTGTPKAPTAVAGTNTTQIATTAFVTNAVANKTTITGNAGTATKLAAEKTIALTGDVTGSAKFDGSEDVTITATIADDSHNHTIANVDGLQSALDSKANKNAGVFYIEGTGDTAGTWLGSHDGITEYYAGLLIAYKPSIAGASTTTLNINDLGAVTVIRNVSTKVTTHYGENSVIFLVYTVDTASDGTTIAYWKVADYDGDTKTRSSNLASTKMYLIGAKSQSTSGQTTYSNSKCYIGTDNCLYSNGAKVSTTDTNTTYSLTKSGSTITLTGSDGSSTSVTDSDTDTVYTHPSYTAKSSGLYKVTVDSTGHVSATSAVTKADITDLGIPAQDTVYTLPTASSALGGVKTTSTVTSTSGLTACPIIGGVPYYKDTKNTYTLSSFSVTATAAELNVLDGITATTAELNYVDGVTSNIQTQLNGKLSTSGGDMTGNITFGSDTGVGVKWGTRTNSGSVEQNPYMGYCTDSGDGTFVVGSLLGTTYLTGLAIGGSSGNLLWKGARILDSNNFSGFALSKSGTAAKATADASGNNIVNTYATKASLASVATSGSYNDLTNKPTIPAAYVLPNATDSVLGGVKIGGNITVNSGTISLTKSNVTTALGYTPPTKDTTYSAASTSAAGLMSAADKAKLDGIAEGANNYTYTLPTAGSSLGGVKTTSTVTSTSGLTACPIISGVPYYKDTNNTYTLSSFGVTATAAELNTLDGITATVTELNYCDGVTSNIQTQLNGKLSTSGKAASATTADKATALATARTISLTGDVTGSTTFDGSGDKSIATTTRTNPTYKWTVGGDAYGVQLRQSGDSGEQALSFVTYTDATFATTSKFNTVIDKDGTFLPTCAKLTGATFTGAISGTTATFSGAIKGATVQATSDERLKSNIVAYDADLSSLQAYQYTLNADQQTHIGLIAQQVKQVVPSAVIEDEQGYYSLDYNAIVALLVNKVNALEARIAELENKA